MLRLQIDHGQQAFDAFLQWCDAPSDSAAETVFHIEQEADGVRRDVVLALSTAFSTPLDREDIDDLSERLDDIVDSVRNTVREARALKIQADEPMKHMIANLKEGLLELGYAIGALPKDPHAAVEHAVKCHHTERLNERIYTQALVALFESNDFKKIFRQREIYSLVIQLSETLEISAEQLVHAINKLG